MANNDYKVDSIKVLSDIEHIRTRPGMYIGELDVPPLALFNEAIDNALDESQSGTNSKVIVKVEQINETDWKYSIRDFGRGIPIGSVDLPDGQQMEALEVLITTTNSGAKFNSESYRIRSGLNGVGMACICALSKYMRVVTYRNCESVEFISENGIKKELNYADTISELNGVLIEFIADNKIWNSSEIPLDLIVDRCKISKAMGYSLELYYNNEKIEINTKSILDLLPTENVSDYCSDIIKLKNNETGEYFLIGFKYTSDTKSKSYGYTNLLPNRYGGTHIKIITDNLCKAWREFYNDDSVWWNDSLLGIRLVVAAFIDNTAFSSQTKDKLTVPYKQLNFFGEEFLKEFKKWMKKNRNLSDKLFARFKEYRQSLIKLQNQKDIAGKVKIATVDKEGKTRRSQIVDKLMDCTSTKVEDTELFIVEGDSAAGVVARPRDRKTQAVLPLRGKIQNVSGMSYKDALKHETVANIINSLGAGIGESADPKKCRYERIIISTDADDDGCFDGNTRIKCTDGHSYSFKDLVDYNIQEIPVYSKDENGNTIKTLGRNPRITKYVDELIEITLNNGFKIKCTLDHPFRVESGNYIIAKNLNINEKLSSINNDLFVVEQKILSLDKAIPVYDLTVDFYHNFAIEADIFGHEGIFVHNCHIVALVLTALVNLVPPLVRAGMVYLLDPPLYKYYMDGKPIYTSDFDSVPENAKGFIRFKGLGAMEDEDFKNTCLNKNNRTLYQITYPDDIDQFNYIAGTSAGRSELLKRYGVVRDINAELEESGEN